MNRGGGLEDSVTRLRLADARPDGTTQERRQLCLPSGLSIGPNKISVPRRDLQFRLGSFPPTQDTGYIKAMELLPRRN
jgi:hypothetical protein